MAQVALCFGLAAGALVLAVGGFAGGSAGAQAGDTTVAVDSVDARGGDVAVGGAVVGAEPSSLTVSVDGREVPVEAVTALRPPGERVEVVAVVDNAEVLGNATVQLSKDALEALVPGKGVSGAMAVVSAAPEPRIEVGLTDSAAQVEQALDEIDPVGASDTWGAVEAAAGLFRSDDPDVSRQVVLITASRPSTSGSTAATAEAALARAGAQLDAVVLSRGTDLQAVSQTVGAVGGSIVTATDEEQLDTSVATLAERIQGRFRLTFAAPVDAGDLVELTVAAGDARTTVVYEPGAVITGSLNLASGSVSEPGFLQRLLENPMVRWAVILAGIAAVILFVWTLVTTFMPDDDNLVRRLRVYEDPYGEQPAEEADPAGRGMTTVPILKRAVDLTGDLAERRGLLDKVEITLERANLPLRAAEALFFVGAGATVLGVLVLVVSRNPLVALVALGLGLLLPKVAVDMRVRRRAKAFSAQLPDMLTLMAGTLRAGYSIGQGFEAVSQEVDDPMGRELRRVVSENRLGRPLDEALDSVAVRMGSEDFAWAVMAIKIQREVGGNLAELLLTVANTMTQRERLRRDVLTLTAEGRMSAIVLGFLPPALGAVMWVMNPDYINSLFTPGLGYVLLGVAAAAMLIGFAWMKKIVKIEV